MRLTEVLKKKKKRLLSIDFGQAFTKIAYIELTPEGIVVLDYSLKKINLSEKDWPAVTGYINNFLKANSIPEKEAHLTISDFDSVYIKHLLLPAVRREEILEAIKWQIKPELPFNFEGSIVDWQVVKEYADEEGAKNITVMCAFANPEIINKYLSAVRECNLAPVRISSAPFNYACILSRLKNIPSTIAVLDIGHNNATVSIYCNNKLNFMRNLAFSSDKLTRSLTSTLMSDKGKIELSYEQAEELKIDFGIPADESGILKDNIRAIHVVSLMRPVLEGLTRETRRSFDYFTSTFKERFPSFLYVTGGGANLKNVEQYLARELNLNVSKLPLPDCINTQKIDKERLSRDEAQMASLLGAVLAGPEEINLLPQEIKTQKIEFVQKVSLRVVTIALAAIFLFLLFIFNFQLHDYKKRLRTARIHLETIANIRDIKQKIGVKAGLIKTIQKDRIPAGALLKLLSTIIGQNIVLDDLSLDQGSHTLILKGSVSVNEGTAEAVLADFIKRIKASTFFTQASLIASQNTGGIQEFEIKCDLSH